VKHRGEDSWWATCAQPQCSAAPCDPPTRRAAPVSSHEWTDCCTTGSLDTQWQQLEGSDSARRARLPPGTTRPKHTSWTEVPRMTAVFGAVSGAKAHHGRHHHHAHHARLHLAHGARQDGMARHAEQRLAGMDAALLSLSSSKSREAAVAIEFEKFKLQDWLARVDGAAHFAHVDGALVDMPATGSGRHASSLEILASRPRTPSPPPFQSPSPQPGGTRKSRSPAATRRRF